METQHSQCGSLDHSRAALAAQPRRPSRWWTWGFALLGFAIGCEVHVQRTLFGVPATPILLAFFGAVLGKAIGMVGKRETAADITGRWIAFAFGLVVGFAVLLGAVIYVTVVMRRPAQPAPNKEIDTDRIKAAK